MHLTMSFTSISFPTHQIHDLLLVWAEVAVGKVVELVEQFLPEARKRLERLVDVPLELREYTFGVVARLDPHQVDETRLALDLRADEQLPQGVIETLLALVCLGRRVHCHSKPPIWCIDMRQNVSLVLSIVKHAQLHRS